LSNARSIDARELEGNWVHKVDRQPSPDTPGIDMETEDRLAIAVRGGDAVSVAYEFRLTRLASREGARFSCNHRKDMTASGRELLSGAIKSGVVVGVSTHLETKTDDCARCSLCTEPAKMFVLALHGNTLNLYRTDGKKAPEIRTFVRDK
jgi:hypothetical protein